MNKDYWIRWLYAAGIRAIRSAAQAVILLTGTDAVNFITLDWVQIAGVAAGMAFVSLLTSIAGLPEVKAGE